MYIQLKERGEREGEECGRLEIHRRLIQYCNSCNTVSTKLFGRFQFL